MEGVEILKTIEITETAGWIVPTLIILVLILLSSTACIQESINEIIPSTIAVVSGLAFVIVLGFFFFSKGIPTGTYKYDVEVAENVSMNDFYDKYIILKKYDYANVYSVEERQND